MRTISRPHWMTLAAVGLYIVALDQATKELVRSTLSPGEDLHLAGTFSIEPFRMSVLATLAVAALLVFLARVGTLDRPVLVGFGLVIGGGVGNLVDRLRLGYVTDFILHGNNAFNLADVAILVGTLLILVGLVASLARPRLRTVRP
ncbi:MAG: signal peptidase II [Actinobacteria bacterium]|nr:MAG: signal peptidase II [Actinomycetota bacterium]